MNIMEKKNEFKPYIPADKIVPEFTVTSIVIGIILAVVFGAANAYLGLIVGMTVSASIPAAVISMGIIRVILRKIPFSKQSCADNRFRRRVCSGRCYLHSACIIYLG